MCAFLGDGYVIEPTVETPDQWRKAQSGCDEAICFVEGSAHLLKITIASVDYEFRKTFCLVAQWKKAIYVFAWKASLRHSGVIHPEDFAVGGH